MEDDVWIGINSIILSCVTLGKGSVIAAGSVITSSTKPSWIYDGNPAKLIKSRFLEKYVDMISELDLSVYTKELSDEKIDYVHKKIDDVLITL